MATGLSSMYNPFFGGYTQMRLPGQSPMFGGMYGGGFNPYQMQSPFGFMSNPYLFGGAGPFFGSASNDNQIRI